MPYRRKRFAGFSHLNPRPISPPTPVLFKPKPVIRRSMRIRKAVHSDEKWGFIEPPKYTTNILDLPNELLLIIFKMLPREQLLSTIASVCTRWKDLIAICWTKIVLKSDMSRELVHLWISRSTCLRQLVIKNRRDVNEILECVLIKCKELENLALYTCSGTRRSSRLQGDLMYDLLTKSPKLSSIILMGTRFNSCIFFIILAEPHRNVSYIGGITYRELIALLESAQLYYKEKIRVLSIKTMTGRCRVNLDSEKITFLLDVLEKKNKDTYIMIIWDGTTEMYNYYFNVQDISFKEVLL